MKYELNDNQVSNLLVFLDRVEIKGLNEVQAISEILNLLQNPIVDENEVNTK